MQFAKSLRPHVRSGRITVSGRIWQSPRVRVGHAYRMEDGFVIIDAIRPISLADVTPELARESGFAGLVDLLKVARHGAGTNIYLVRFHYADSLPVRDQSSP
ncbi:ASCH domain-containing protein [Escherichia coli]|nr:ASCH domain-containing protein [Escherichia coli]